MSEEKKSPEPSFSQRRCGPLGTCTLRPPQGPAGATPESPAKCQHAQPAHGSRASGGVAGLPGRRRPGTRHTETPVSTAGVKPGPAVPRRVGRDCFSPWASQGLCRVLLEPYPVQKGQLAFLPNNAKPVCCTCRSRSLKDSSLRKQSPPSLPSGGPPRPAHLTPHPLITHHTLRWLYFLL